MKVAFFITIALSFAITRKIASWSIIQVLGFPSECPLLFLRSAVFYYAADWLVWLGALAIGLGSPLSVWIVILFLIGARIYAGGSGRQAAFAKYREVMADLKARATTAEDVARFTQQLSLSDGELRQMAIERNRHAMRMQRLTRR
jgi:hypothetical protein